jgi:hypothetical protein
MRLYSITNKHSSYFVVLLLLEILHSRWKFKLPVSLEIKRNATGHIVDLSGVSALMLDWLTRRYKLKSVRI